MVAGSPLLVGETGVQYGETLAACRGSVSADIRVRVRDGGRELANCYLCSFSDAALAAIGSEAWVRVG